MRVLKEKLVEKLKQNTIKEFKIVVMPHFCIDNFVQCGKDYESFVKKIEDIVKQGGGNISINQILSIGGKAANCASALVSLGIPTYLITKTNEFGYKLLEYFFKGKNVDLSHISKDGKLAFTTAIELKGVNIMISDPGSLSQFGPKYLTDKDEKLIRDADIVGISDWGLNDEGSELANYVFQIVKDGKKGKTFFDPGDPTPKGRKLKEEIAKMVSKILEKGLVDMLSINEYEAKKYGKINNLDRAINYLREMVRIELHTKDYAKSIYNDKETEKIPTFDVEIKRLTGAGDAWNAGNIIGEIIGLSDELRLMLANAVAGYYISDSKGRHPTRQNLIKFLEQASFKKIISSNSGGVKE